MADNKFLIFDENATNIQTDIEYEADTQRLDGVTPGKARSILHNKVFRQVSIMASAIGQIIAEAGTEANDSSFTNLVNAIKDVFKKAGAISYATIGTKLKSTNVQDALNEATNYTVFDVLGASWSPTTYMGPPDGYGSAGPPYYYYLNVGVDIQYKERLNISLEPSAYAIYSEEALLKEQFNYSKINYAMIYKYSNEYKTIKLLCLREKPDPSIDLKIRVEGL